MLLDIEIIRYHHALLENNTCLFDWKTLSFTRTYALISIKLKSSQDKDIFYEMGETFFISFVRTLRNKFCESAL